MKFSGLREKIMQIPNMAEKSLTNNLLTDDMWLDWVKQVVFSCRMSRQLDERFAKYYGQWDNYWTHHM